MICLLIGYIWFMRKISALLVLIGLFAACKKSNQSGSGSGSGSIDGTWNFLYMTATTRDNQASVGGYSSTTFMSYKTINNSGTVTFTTDSMRVTNLSYSVSGNAETYLYLGNTLQDSVSIPVSAALPATTESILIKQIGSDSLYAPNGGIVPASYNGTVIGAGQPSGVHYVIKNDTLNMTQIVSTSVSGASVSAVATMTLVRQ